MAHPQLPFIVHGLELRTNVNEGRHIVTNKPLKPGEIIAIEDAFIHGTYEDFNYRRCTHCTKENMLNLIPCDSCTNSMFCSQECMNEAVDDFHKFECPITDFLTAFQPLRFALRLVVRGIQCFTSADELFEFMKDSTKLTVFSFDHTKPLSTEQRYLLVHSLETNEEKQSEGDLLFRSMYSSILMDQLLKHTSVKDMLSFSESEAARVALADVIYNSFLVIPQNGHYIV